GTGGNEGAAEFRVERPTGCRERANRVASRGVPGEPGCVDFGIAAAEVETVYARERLGQRAPEDELGARLAQHLEILGVVELERLVARDADSRDPRGRGCPPRAGRARGGPPRATGRAGPPARRIG